MGQEEKAGVLDGYKKTKYILDGYGLCSWHEMIIWVQVAMGIAGLFGLIVREIHRKTRGNEFPSIERTGEQERNGMNIKQEKAILWGAFSLCFLFPFLNLIVWFGNCEIMIGTWGTAFLLQMLFNFIAFISGTLLCMDDYHLETEQKQSDQVFLGMKICGLVVLLLMSNAVCLFLHELGGCYHSFSSPDGTHTIVVEEEQLIHDVRVSVYERVHPLLISFRGSEVKNNTDKPVETEDYSLKWEENGVTFVFDGGREAIFVPFD